MTNKTMNKDIFRAYDIRGKVGTEWCENNNYTDAFLIGQAIGTQLVTKHSPQLIVGHDGRLSSQNINAALIKGLLSVGCDVTDIGLTATPVTFFAISQLKIKNALMITGSHSPATTNGIKTVFDSKPVTADEIESFYFDILKDDFSEVNTGKLSHYEKINQDYQDAIIDNIHIKRPLRIGIDASNGATSLFAEALFSRLNCEVHPLFCNIDGTFPNHSPDPTKPDNLTPLIELVTRKKLDMGIAFDGDGDRFIAVDNEGNILWPDRIMILLAQSILKTHAKSTIVFDVKCSYLLPQMITQAGGTPSMCKTGHSMLKLQMLALDSPLGGEYTGHIVLRDRWNDFDDGPYAAARLLEILSQHSKTSTQLFSDIPQSFTTPEYTLHLDNIQQCQEVVKTFIQQADFPNATLSTLDGLRVDYEDGWGLIRASNTGPSIGFRFEAKTSQRLKEIQKQFKTPFKSFDTLKLPF